MAEIQNGYCFVQKIKEFLYQLETEEDGWLYGIHGRYDKNMLYLILPYTSEPIAIRKDEHLFAFFERWSKALLDQDLIYNLVLFNRCLWLYKHGVLIHVQSADYLDLSKWMKNADDSDKFFE